MSKKQEASSPQKDEADKLYGYFLRHQEISIVGIIEKGMKQAREEERKRIEGFIINEVKRKNYCSKNILAAEILMYLKRLREEAGE